mgnify:CR=1 FL=1|jgi:hypothetical protein
MPYKIAMICVLLPLFTVHLTLTVSIFLENLQACLPYWSDCHSISATGRQYPEFFVFKALMIPTAVFMGMYWLLMYVWLKQISNNKLQPVLITGFGCIAVFMLIVYTVTLGAVGEPYALARRLGVTVYFGFTAGAHLLLLVKFRKVNTQLLKISGEVKAMFYLCIVMLSTAVASAVAGLVWEEGWDNWENAYEWWFSLVMISLFYCVARMWKKTHFKVTFSTKL